jgi:hypothetical protein
VCICASLSLSPKDHQHPSFFLISRRISPFSLFLFRFLVTHKGAKTAKYALSAFSLLLLLFFSVRLLQLQKYDRITQCVDLYTTAAAAADMQIFLGCWVRRPTIFMQSGCTNQHTHDNITEPLNVSLPGVFFAPF